MNLLNAVTVDGSSGKELVSGLMNLYVVGTFGGGTVTLEALAPDGTTYLPIPNASLTANGMVTLDLPITTVRATLSGSTAASVSAWLELDDNATYQAAAARKRA